MEKIKIKSKHDCYGNKCPFCLRVHVNFADLGDDLLGCLKCGCVFIEKGKRADLEERQVEILVEQLKEKAAAAEEIKLTCECGFEAKNNAGLAAHQRKCAYLIEKDYELRSSGN